MFLNRAIRSEILSKLYFTSESGELELNFDENYPSGYITIICEIKGSPFKYTCVSISEEAESIFMHIDEPQLGSAL